MCECLGVQLRLARGWMRTRNGRGTQGEHHHVENHILYGLVRRQVEKASRGVCRRVDYTVVKKTGGVGCRVKKMRAPSNHARVYMAVSERFGCPIPAETGGMQRCMESHAECALSITRGPASLRCHTKRRTHLFATACCTALVYALHSSALRSTWDLLGAAASPWP